MSLFGLQFQLTVLYVGVAQAGTLEASHIIATVKSETRVWKPCLLVVS